ncbi:MAG: hypothetical protein GY869_05340, partial [Planctomycetes bacterium]|nr:hypothetical protein [Planctomycetota bacterium]
MKITNVVGNTGTGNSGDYLEIRTGTLNDNSTWKKQAGLPYVVTGYVSVYDYTGGTATLTIEPGVEVKFSSGAGLYIGHQSYDYPGSLKAQGTEADPIIFTSSNPSPTAGSWEGIAFYSSTNDPETILENCVIEYGGRSGSGNIYFYNSSPRISNCKIRESSGYGIRT